ncbi:MAG TPA: TonB-dependent receptor [Candidatus Binatia bacterium]|nr:TonB-dependent receptor [Candidatus Binatia bacterium]
MRIATWGLVLGCIAGTLHAQESSDTAAEPGAAPSPPAESTQQPAAAAPPAEVVPVQEASPPASSPGEPIRFDTLEVTAQRRRQKLQDVPVAVTAMTQDQVQVRGITRLDDLNSLAPGLQVSRSPANTTISQLAIRGSSQINPAIYWDPAVGVYLDGVYIGKAQGSIFDIVDLAGIEVLRGPQGTLYGRNTIAGAINFVTREPTGVFSGHAAIEYGTFGDRVLRAALDLPRLGFADLTLGARSERRDGWVRCDGAQCPVSELNNRHSDGLHFASLMDLRTDLEALYRFDWTDTDQSNSFLQLVRSDDPRLQSYVHRPRQTQADINAPSGELAKVQGHALTLNWTHDARVTLKSITGWRKVRWVDKLDLDGSPRVIAQSQRHTRYEQLSQDLTLSGHVDPFTYTAGAYYFQDDGYTVNPIYVESGALDFDSRYGTQSRAWALYGQGDWLALEKLTVTAGARYTREKKDLDRVYGYRSASVLPYTYYMPPGYRAPGATFSAFTPMAALAWRFNPQLNVYVRYAEGFKSGGFNGEYSSISDTPEANQQETDTPFRPERQKSLELGAKTSFFGGKALANVAVFQNKLTDLQASIFVASGAAASVIRNAGKATVRGLELETALVPVEGTQLRAGIALLDPKYDEFLDAGRNEADNRAFVHAPRTAYNLVADSQFWQTRHGALRAVVDWVWTDSFYTYPYQLQPDPNPPGQQKAEAENTRVAAYGLLNARILFAGIPLGGTRLGEIALWGRNLTDDATASNFIDFGPGAFQNLTIANFVEPRAIGLSGALRW